MKNPNGYGTVVKLKGNRRRPYVVRKTVGWEGDRRIIKAVGYYATREEAMRALADYNQSPYDVDARKITMAELYERWCTNAAEQGRLAIGTLRSIRSAYRHCVDLADRPYATIRAHMMQECIDGCGAGYGTQAGIKKLFFHLDNYGMELDILDKRYSGLVHVAAATPAQKTIFSDLEVVRLWDNINTPWVDTVLILLYSGWRIAEFLDLTKENVHIDPTGKTVNTMRGGKKTRAGKDRIVPIHSAILPLVQARYDSAKNHLIEMCPGKMISIRHYRRHWNSVMGIIDARHTPHETRHTFRSWLDAVNAPLSCTNRIMGHVCGDIGLQVYTHKTIEDLRATIELIKSEHSAGQKAVSNE
jgi:hypothetical protein